MFAYCNNNPANSYDADGTLTRRQIHDLALEKIKEEAEKRGRSNLSMKDTCIYRNSQNASAGWGFCDLYDSGTGEVWELKRSTCNLDSARTQLGNYTRGALKHHLGLPLKTGQRLLPEGYIGYYTHRDASGTYKIRYWDNGDGILLYDYTYEKSTNKKVIDGLGIGALGLCTAGLIISAVLTSGATAPEVVSVVIILVDRVAKIS